MDPNGHVNQAQYYTFFDNVLLNHLRTECDFDPCSDPAMIFCVENQCSFYSELLFGEVVEVGMRIAKIGTSSVKYEFGIFRSKPEDLSALSYFIEVFVDRVTRRPVPVPERVKNQLIKLKY